MKSSLSRYISLIMFVVLFAVGVAGRLAPHAPNVAPITAIALFASVYFGVRYAGTLSLLVMLSTDLFIGLYDWRIMLAVYGSFALATLVGAVVRRNKTVKAVFLGTLVSSLVFFIITNGVVWAFGTLYERSLAGLVESYLAGIPFLKASLVGDMLYVALFFGLYELVSCVLNYGKARFLFALRKSTIEG